MPLTLPRELRMEVTDYAELLRTTLLERANVKVSKDTAYDIVKLMQAKELEIMVAGGSVAKVYGRIAARTRQVSNTLYNGPTVKLYLSTSAEARRQLFEKHGIPLKVKDAKG